MHYIGKHYITLNLFSFYISIKLVKVSFTYTKVNNLHKNRNKTIDS